MFNDKLKAAAQCLVCIALPLALTGGTMLAFDSAQPDGNPLPTGVGHVRALAPVPKNPPAEPAVRLRLTTLQATNIDSVAFSPDGKTIASGHWTLTLWDAASGRELTSFRGHHAGCSGYVAFHPDGKMLAVTCLGSPAFSDDLFSVYVWDLSKRNESLSEGKPQFCLKGHKSCVRVVAYSPDGKLLASLSDDGVAKLWDAATGIELSTLTGGLRGLSFRPDGKVLATSCGDDAIKLWDVATGKELANFVGLTTPQSPLAFSTDGKSIASAAKGNTVVLWEVPNGKETQFRARVTLNGHRDKILAVAFSPDGKLLATGSEDKTVRLWDVATGQEKAILTKHTEAVHRVTFSPDGKTLLSGSRDGTLQLWDVSREINRPHSAKTESQLTVSRKIDLPHLGKYYKHLYSQAINSRKEFDALLLQIKGAELTQEDQTALLKALADARVDFDRESLVLIRHDEPEHDPARVTFTSTRDGDALLCAIHRENPAANKVPNERVYCFALAVQKDKIKKVDVSVNSTED